jgi:hypothetical protein
MLRVFLFYGMLLAIISRFSTHRQTSWSDAVPKRMCVKTLLMGNMLYKLLNLRLKKVLNEILLYVLQENFNIKI